MSRTAPHIIVLGNEKGGTGKSTTAMHVIAACMDADLSVGALDLDGRQKSLARYLENRQSYMDDNDIELFMPVFRSLQPAQMELRSKSEEADRNAFMEALTLVSIGADVVVIDTPGSSSYLGQLAHRIADTLITPMNDSFMDFDLLGTVDVKSGKVTRPSIYAEMVWDAKKNKAAKAAKPIDWIVIRNRLSPLDAHNKRRVEASIKELSRRVGFRFEPGLSERVIYRELFLKGLTLLDFGVEGVGGSMTMSHVAAKQELRDLLHALDLSFFAEAQKRSA